jgi:hypothetical protein
MSDDWMAEPSGVDWQVVYDAIDAIHSRLGDCIESVVVWHGDIYPVSCWIEYRNRYAGRLQLCVVKDGIAEWR